MKRSSKKRRRAGNSRSNGNDNGGRSIGAYGASRHPGLDISVTIPFAGKREAASAAKALIPDNVNFPKGLSMTIGARGSTVAIQIKGAGVSPATVLATLDEVLEHISTARKVISG